MYLCKALLFANDHSDTSQPSHSVVSPKTLSFSFKIQSIKQENSNCETLRTLKYNVSEGRDRYFVIGHLKHTKHPVSIVSFCLVDRGGEKEALPESRQT